MRIMANTEINIAGVRYWEKILASSSKQSKKQIESINCKHKQAIEINQKQDMSFVWLCTENGDINFVPSLVTYPLPWNLTRKTTMDHCCHGFTNVIYAGNSSIVWLLRAIVCWVWNWYNFFPFRSGWQLFRFPDIVQQN